jgi:hypothetical protein
MCYFLDEFPRLNTPKSGFLSAFEYFWNSWGTPKDNLILTICGSAASCTAGVPADPKLISFITRRRIKFRIPILPN